MTSKYREKSQVKHTSYSVGKGAVLGGSIVIESWFSPAQKNPDHENGKKLFNGLTPQLKEHSTFFENRLILQLPKS